MKNIYLLILILGSSCFSFSQDKQSEDIVIYSTSNKNTNLFFTNSIKSAIVGNSNFTVGYSKEKNSNIAILKSVPGEESNLLVITENGNIFSFIIRHKSEIQRLNYFIKDFMAVGNESGEINSSVLEPTTQSKKTLIQDDIVEPITVNNYEENNNSSRNDSLNNYKENSLKELNKPLFYNRIYGVKDKVYVKLKNITYVNNELYFTIILKNESTLDYDINYLNFYITSRNKKRNTTTQTIPYKYEYVENLPTRIPANETLELVYIFQKFSINENKILLVEMTEINGERSVKLEIPNTFINNPN